MSTLAKPNFFIIGSAKSGTTTLYHYLKQHPNVLLTRPKETNFFSDYFQGFNSITRANDYFSQFKKKECVTAYGEASHSYMTSSRTANTLGAIFPEAKLVFILRNPAERAHSLYHHLRRYGHEASNSFERALDLEEYRLSSATFKNSCKENIYNFAYFRSGLYGEQIGRYLKIFPPDQCLFLRLEDLNEKPLFVFNTLCKFLNINHDVNIKLSRRNVGEVTARFPIINHISTKYFNRIISPSKPSGRIGSIMHNILFIKKEKILDKTKYDLMKKYNEDQIYLKSLIGFNFQ